MKALVATLIIALGLLGCSTLGFEEDKQAQEDFAWLEMCQLLEDETNYGCSRLEQPFVVYEAMEEGLLGYYDGSDTIYINITLGGSRALEVLMHEGIHYVHVMHYFIVVPSSNMQELCWSEEHAWGLTGVYFNEDNSTWWRAYPHCWEFYATTPALRDLGKRANDIEKEIDEIIFED